MAATAVIWVRLYGFAWALAGIALVAWGAPAYARHVERGRHSQTASLRPFAARFSLLMLRFVGVATVIGGIVIALFPDQF